MPLFLITLFLIFLFFFLEEGLALSLVASTLFTLVFFLFSAWVCVFKGEPDFKEEILNINSIAINKNNYWIYTKEGEVFDVFNPEISDGPSIRKVYLYPPKLWYFNFPLDADSININIKDLYEKTVK